ncbi:Glycosyl hydrolase family 3 C terminal domain [Sphingomonas paucimobilis]|nr:Glycosyl hydrolase family 3 C terminal domain [Sphingomonas paucimobilis]
MLVEAAAAGMVLLRNEGDLLPMTPGRHRRIAVIGPNAAAPCYQGGTFAKIALSPDAARPLEAITARYAGVADIVYEPGVDPQPRLPAMPVEPVRGDGPGMTVEYFADGDLSGQPIGQEVRDTNSLVWFVGVHDQGVFDRPAAIRASGWFTAVADGAHRFYVGATGAGLPQSRWPVVDRTARADGGVRRHGLAQAGRCRQRRDDACRWATGAGRGRLPL